MDEARFTRLIAHEIIVVKNLQPLWKNEHKCLGFGLRMLLMYNAVQEGITWVYRFFQQIKRDLDTLAYTIRTYKNGVRMKCSNSK